MYLVIRKEKILEIAVTEVVYFRMKVILHLQKVQQISDPVSIHEFQSYVTPKKISSPPLTLSHSLSVGTYIGG